MRIVFAGTPQFAVPTLDAVLAGRHEVALVVTQPDRGAGRGRRPLPPPVKVLAQERGARVIQPRSINDRDATDEIEAVHPDAMLVVAYGRRLTKRTLRIARLGTFNIHASLLPKYRGAAPVHYALLNGDRETGVTLQRMAPAVDTGPVLAQRRTPIGPGETTGELSERLAKLAAEMIAPALDLIERGEATERPQNDGEASAAPKLSKRDGAIPWARSAEAIHNFVRAMTPWPGAWTFLHPRAGGRPLRLVVRAVESEDAIAAREAEPGCVVRADDCLTVAAGSGTITLRRVVPEGGRPMSGDDFLRGHRVSVGDRFRESP